MTESAANADEQLGARWRSALSRADVEQLLEFHDLRSWGSIALNWGLVLACFALVASWPNPVTLLVAVFVIGARQLGFAVLMHEASHRSLLRDRNWNDRVGNWLCAYPIWSDLRPYRPYHLKHHARTASAQDPDIGLVVEFLPGGFGARILRVAYQSRWSCPIISLSFRSTIRSRACWRAARIFRISASSSGEQ